MLQASFPLDSLMLFQSIVDHFVSWAYNEVAMKQEQFRIRNLNAKSGSSGRQ